MQILKSVPQALIIAAHLQGVSTLKGATVVSAMKDSQAMEELA